MFTGCFSAASTFLGVVVLLVLSRFPETTTALFGELILVEEVPADELFRRFLERLSTELRSKSCRRNGRSFPASNEAAEAVFAVDV